MGRVSPQKFVVGVSTREKVKMEEKASDSLAGSNLDKALPLLNAVFIVDTVHSRIIVNTCTIS